MLMAEPQSSLFKYEQDGEAIPEGVEGIEFSKRLKSTLEYDRKLVKKETGASLGVLQAKPPGIHPILLHDVCVAGYRFRNYCTSQLSIWK